MGFILLFVLNGTWEVFKKANSARIEKNNVQRELTELGAQKEHLQSSINRLNTDWGIEQEVREKFGVVKKGEEVVIIVNGGDAGEGEDISKESLWSRIKGIF